MRAPFLAVNQNFFEKFLFVTITDYYRFKILVFVVVPIQEVRGMRAPFLAVNQNLNLIFGEERNFVRARLQKTL